MADSNHDHSDVQLDLSDDILKLESFYFAVGEVSDVYRCKMIKSNRTVAVKVMRGISSDPRIREKFQKRLLRLVKQWKRLSHHNVMPCFGYCKHFGPMIGLVLPMCIKGNIVHYVEKNPQVNRLFMLLQVASGLNYLHSIDFLHGDIRGVSYAYFFFVSKA
jgi:serine/threonine protein kinase